MKKNIKGSGTLLTIHIEGNTANPAYHDRLKKAVKGSVYKNRKAYNRKAKHKKSDEF